MKSLIVIALLVLGAAAPAQQVTRWWKGNLHTHTFWSDGDDFPEMVVDWYKTRGYDFLALSDHNILQEGSAWVIATNGTAAARALPKYLRRFGSNWVEQGVYEGMEVVRLKTLKEFRPQFEQPGRFILLQAEEITDRFARWPIHIIASNIRELVPPQGGRTIVEVMQNNVDAVLEQRKRTGVPMIPHIAHPNFGWALTAEDIAQVKGERFFELYNGHADVRNEGDRYHASTERMWDIINTQRIAERRDAPMWGLAVDDGHHYHAMSPDKSNPGRGWIEVRAPQLTPEAIINALEAGDFYASSGVRLKEIAQKDGRLAVQIEPQEGVTYTTQFIGTRRPVDWSSKEVIGAEGHALATTRVYSKDMGAVLSEVSGTTATYQIKGNELYVRAKIISSKAKENAVIRGETECAWTQPAMIEGARR